MQALVFDGKPRLRDVPAPTPPRGEALLRVLKAGICSTDLEITRGYMGYKGVLGHEFVARVEKGPRAWMGKRVVGEINCVCGRCALCRAGLSNHCTSRTVLGIAGRDGAFAEFTVLPVRNLHEVPESVSDAEACFVEPLAAALQVPRQVRFDKAQEVVVLGDGRLGQLVARVLKPRVKRVTLVGRHAAKLEAADKQGIQTCLEKEFVPKATAPIVIDATGSATGLELAMRTVRPRGTLVLKSTVAAGAELNLAPLVIDEITVVGSRCGPFPEAVAALAARQIDVSALISAEMPLSKGIEALEAARDGRNIKVLLDVGR